MHRSCSASFRSDPTPPVAPHSDHSSSPTSTLKTWTSCNSVFLCPPRVERRRPARDAAQLSCQSVLSPPPVQGLWLAPPDEEGKPEKWSQRSWEKRKDALDRHLDAGVSMDNVGWKGEGRQAGCHPAFEKCTLQTTKPPPSVGIANLIKRFQKYSTELAKPKNSHPKSCGDEFDRLVPHRCLHANLAPQGLASQADLQSGQAPRGGGGVC